MKKLKFVQSLFKQMGIQEYLTKMSSIQKLILSYIEYEASSLKPVANLMEIFNNLKALKDKHELKSVLHMLSNIADNHHRGPCFFERIEKIINFLKLDMKSNFSNFSIFNIFKSNKRILWFLIKEEIITVNKTIESILTKKYEYQEASYSEYLFTMPNHFTNKKLIQEIKENLDEYEKKQAIGENDSRVCELIREDLLDDFVDFVTKEKLSLERKIEKSIFESNPLLLSRGASLIEYAAFFGSVKIFNYLQENGNKLTPSLWLYAIHGKNNEIIRLLEENHIKLEESEYSECFSEAIKCHHNEIADYIRNKYGAGKDEKSSLAFEQCLKSYNISLIQTNSVDQSSFCDLCQYDYFCLVDIISKDKGIDVHKIKIYISSFIQSF